eukprot:TRINITY_DN29506_c0_g1_i1.p1 TRINITY_DN29506_c0_g1~~TRINITY_DN29506_c0_g1_i1.p1  ORF type:complete len:1494 (+),score=340.76 TRINITY_DN29506_c0_g1_i1:216-4697(+)
MATPTGWVPEVPGKADLVARSLRSMPLFDNIEDDILADMGERAKLQKLRHGTEVDLSPGSPLVIVIEGPLQVCVGRGPATVLGPGDALNGIGMLSLASEAEDLQPFNMELAGSSPGGDDSNIMGGQKVVLSSVASSPTSPMTVSGGRVRDLSKATDGSAVVKLLCSNATSTFGEGTKITNTIRFMVQAGDGVSTGETTIATLPYATIQRALQEDLDQLETFRNNVKEATATWKLLLSCMIFPAMPLEVAWAMAMVAQRQVIDEDLTFVTEGDISETAQSLIFLEEGQAVVEKLIGQTGKAEKRICGSLQAGAVLGDVCLVGVRVARPASARAETTVKIVRLLKSNLLLLLRRFPGLMSCLKIKLRETALLLQPGLPARRLVLDMTQVLSRFSAECIRTAGNACERRLFHCGDVIRAEGSADSTLSIIEFGMCSVEVTGKGLVALSELGTCFGERTFLGLASVSSATIRVASPLAMVLMLSRATFENVLQHFPQDARLFENTTELASLPRGSNASKLSVLQSCGTNFCDEIEKGLTMRCYMPGQTICVEGGNDAGSMYVIKGGRVGIEICGRMVKELVAGAAFGELAMLGLVRRRTCTVRAVTVCFLFEIPRITFLAALDKSPEERPHFERMTAHFVSKERNSTAWPMFDGASVGFSCSLNRYAEVHITPAGFWASSKSDALPTDVAVIVVQGTIKVLDEEDNVIGMLHEGDCINEALLVDLPARAVEFMPMDTCEVQILSRSGFRKILAENTEKDAAWARQQVRGEMLLKAEARRGIERGTSDVLCLSALFRTMPQEARDFLRRRLEARIYKAGACLTKAGDRGDSAFLLVEGQAFVEDDALGQKWYRMSAGTVVGEPVLLGLTNTYSTTVRTEALCLVQVMKRSDFVEGLNEFPAASILLKPLEKLQKQTRTLEEWILNSSLLSQAGMDFFSAACKHVDEVFFAPLEVMLKGCEECHLGECPIYVILAGEATVENEYGISLCSLKNGSICGEGAGLGLAKVRTMTVRAWKGGITHCARLHGMSLKKAIESYPSKFQTLVHIFERRQRDNQEFRIQREQYYSKMVIPSLRETPVMAEVSLEVLTNIVMPLVVQDYKPGENIVLAGEAVDCMHVLAEGEAEVLSQLGHVGRLTRGAVFGEPVLLGLLTTSSATVRAVRTCSVLAVPVSVVKDALAMPGAEKDQRAIERLVEERQGQVEAGMPFCAMQLHGISTSDVCVRISAMLAEKMTHPAGDSWEPLADYSPAGVHLTVIVRGRVNLMMNLVDVPAMTLTAGCILPEDVASKYGANVVAGPGGVEAYRIRMVDFLAASHSLPSNTKWLYHFKMQYQEAIKATREKLANARGVVTSKVNMMRLMDSEHSKINLRSKPGWSDDLISKQPMQRRASEIMAAAGGVGGKLWNISQSNQPPWVTQDRRRSAGGRSKSCSKLLSISSAAAPTISSLEGKERGVVMASFLKSGLVRRKAELLSRQVTPEQMQSDKPQYRFNKRALSAVM